jgi:DNA polymerase III epsilon subunit-like protein
VKFLIFDTESTDLWQNTLVALDKQPEIFDWYGLTLDTDTLEVTNELQVFAKPKGKIAEGAARATKKTDADFANYDPFAVNAEWIKAYIEAHDACLAHNIVFDWGITNFEMQRCGLEVNWPVLIDSVEKSEWIMGYRLTLTALYEFLFGEKFKGAHESKTDVVALKDCWVEMIKRGWV